MKLSIVRAAWLRSWFACTLAVLPAFGLACDLSERKACEKRIVALVAYRSEAIQYAFGDLSTALPDQVRVKFVTSHDPKRPLARGAIAYDPGERVLFMSRSILDAQLPNPLRLAADYWPYYEQEQVREKLPVIEAIDDALWNAYLQAAATARGVAWDSADCRSAYVEKRLPCEMVTSAIAHVVKTRRLPIFNENRIDRVWPEDFAGFVQRSWRRGESEYRDVQLYGGLMLVRPLIGEFGVPRALAYLVQTPFRVEDNNLRASALRYQDRARDALRIQSVDRVARTGADSPSSFSVKGE
jgi:hypothetical protein